MTDIYAELEKYAKKDFPKIPSKAVSKIVREVVEEAENLCYERLANGLDSDANSVLKLLKERYSIEGDLKFIKRAYEERTKGKKHLTEKEKLSTTVAIIGTFKLTAELVRYELELRRLDI